ncbi:MAG TPA: LCP family protein, partial [Acidimicrobiales bacterium]|nr:LCP family protein [Acidimicrobiales bacterium]
MFEHFDDPKPPSPDPEGCTRVVGRARQRRRRRRRRVAVSTTGFVAVGVLAVAGFFVTEARRLDSVNRVDVATQPSSEPGVQTILVVGTDRGVSSAMVGAGAGADAIAAIRIDGAAHTVSVLAIPRDLALADSATGNPATVSAIFRSRGPSGLISSIQDALRVDVSHYIQVDPAGFAALIDSTNGVEVRSSASLRDLRSGFRLPGGVCTQLDGESALALARSRFVEVDRGGRWEPDGLSDIGRMQRENILGRALLDSLQRANLADPVSLDHLVDAFVDHVTVDAGLHRDDLIDLVRTVRSIPVGQISTAWLPLDIGEQPDGATSFELGPDWQATVDEFTSGQVLPGVDP